MFLDLHKLMFCYGKNGIDYIVKGPAKMPQRGRIAGRPKAGQVKFHDKAGVRANAKKVKPDFSTSVIRYYQSDETLWLKRFMSSAGMNESQLAGSLGLTIAVLKRARETRNSRAATRAGEMIEIVHRISPWAGGNKQALAWYRAEPIPAFGGRTAESLVREGKAAAVRNYLDHIATGGFA